MPERVAAEAAVMPIPARLVAPGARPEEAEWQDGAGLEELPAGAMLRITRGDLDVLLAHTAAGIAATDDRCPHMSAPLSQGSLDGCEVDCPLHSGRFDLATGETVRFPTTGGLDPDGIYHPTWTPAGSAPRAEAPSDAKARARALTRIRRMRYYPVRIRDGRIEVALPR